MPSRELLAQVLALPPSERAALAYALWMSIVEGDHLGRGEEARAEAGRRDEEMTSGRVTAGTHEDVMEAARRAIGWA